jgi:hypothetical protein
MSLANELREAEANVEALKRRIAAATCAQIGEHDWKSVGGCNAGCDDDCCCSVPVHACTRCGDCDYGQNKWADETRAKCREKRGVKP